MFISAFKSIHRGISSLAFEEVCLICDSKKEFLCDDCGKNWFQSAKHINGEEFPVFAKVPYDEVAAKVVLSAKESGIKQAKNLLVSALVETTLELLKSLAIEEGRIELVPIPSSRTAQMRRGEDFIYQLTKLTHAKITNAAPLLDIHVRRILRVDKRLRDQSGLSEHERDLNLTGAFQADLKYRNTSQLIIVDDVITTGSTLREAYRALKERNLTAIGAVTACASQRRLLIR
jgi:predicted amidophosphoribosyltransferase